MTKSSSASGAGSLLASRYASSLIEVASGSGILDSVHRDILDIETALSQSAELQALVRSPVYGAKRQIDALNEIGRVGKFQKVTSNFLAVLATNRRLSALESVIRAFYLEMDKRKGEMIAQIKTAHPLTAEQENRLVKELGAKTGQSVRLSVEVDETLLGGMVITLGSKMIDDSLKTKLSRLQKAMMSNTNSQTVSLKEVG